MNQKILVAAIAIALGKKTIAAGQPVDGLFSAEQLAALVKNNSVVERDLTADELEEIEDEQADIELAERQVLLARGIELGIEEALLYDSDNDEIKAAIAHAESELKAKAEAQGKADAEAQGKADAEAAEKAKAEAQAKADAEAAEKAKADAEAAAKAAKAKPAKAAK